jgi:hypothetical protein
MALAWIANLDFAGGSAGVAPPDVPGGAHLGAATRSRRYNYNQGYRYIKVLAWNLLPKS